VAVACDMPPRQRIKRREEEARREDKENKLYIIKLYILTNILFKQILGEVSEGVSRVFNKSIERSWA
jgi:hypothetical protein